MTGVMLLRTLLSKDLQKLPTFPPDESMYAPGTPRNPPAAYRIPLVVVKYSQVVAWTSVNNKGDDWRVPIPDKVTIVSAPPPNRVGVLLIMYMLFDANVANRLPDRNGALHIGSVPVGYVQYLNPVVAL
jgi:hypothetical protein